MRPARLVHARNERSESRRELERATSWFVARRTRPLGAAGDRCPLLSAADLATRGYQRHSGPARFVCRLSVELSGNTPTPLGMDVGEFEITSHVLGDGTLF